MNAGSILISTDCTCTFYWNLFLAIIVVLNVRYWLYKYSSSLKRDGIEREGKFENKNENFSYSNYSVADMNRVHRYLINLTNTWELKFAAFVPNVESKEDCSEKNCGWLW